MSTYLLAFLLATWDWVFAPPLHWLFSLSLEWQIELAILLGVTVFLAPIIEKFVIGREQSGLWWAERKRRREWYRIGGMAPQEFHDLVRSIRRAADKQTRLAERLEGRGGNGFTTHFLRRAAWRRRIRALAFHDEADRLERLWTEIEKERETAADGPATRTKVLRLMRRLDSRDDDAASGALAELRRMGNWFKWESLAPRAMEAPLRDKFIKVLRLMAGTSSLDEARNAYRSALRILQENGWGRHWEAA